MGKQMKYLKTHFNRQNQVFKQRSCVVVSAIRLVDELYDVTIVSTYASLLTTANNSKMNILNLVSLAS